MILLPLVLVVYLAATGVVYFENMSYMIIGALLLYVFVTMLGIHSGLSYVASRTATLASLGTVFFLCVGIAICMTIMVSFRGAFQLQLAPFLVMILGGGAALFADQQSTCCQSLVSYRKTGKTKTRPARQQPVFRIALIHLGRRAGRLLIS